MNTIRTMEKTGVAGIFRCAVVLAFALAAPLHAAEEATVESKLRDALRDTVLKLRDAQGQVAAAQAAQIAAEEKIKELTAKTETLPASRRTPENSLSAVMEHVSQMRFSGQPC